MDPQQFVILTCKYCQLPISQNDYFCPHCGKKMKEKPVSNSVMAIVWLFVLSVFFPPLGLGLTFRYIRSEDDSSRIIGWLSLVATILALTMTILFAKILVDQLTLQMNAQLQGLGL